MYKINIQTYIAETAHPIHHQFNDDLESYTQFSARYGNIYTIRQFLELFKQAFGLMPVVEDFIEEQNKWYDLLRPNVHKHGFDSLEEAIADRKYHLFKVKELFLNSNIFIFTAGLTECWINEAHGHAYPVCPGTVRGIYDPRIHKFKNFNYQEILSDFNELITHLRSVNTKLKLILTVSPVPLVATYTNKNVLVASTYSKSVLRAAVGVVDSLYDNIDYFPSYEIINHPASFGQYLASDLREVTERGVSHVMGCFLSSYFSSEMSLTNSNQIRDLSSTKIKLPDLKISLPECDEMYNELQKNRF